MNNEPVAELVLEQMAVGDASSLRVKWLIDGYPPIGTKLYITPQIKELSDEEILEVAQKMGWRGALGFLINFARAILKKASEK